MIITKRFGLVHWGVTPQQQPGSYQGGEMRMKSVFWWRKPEYPEETTDLRQVTDEQGDTVRNGNKVIDDFNGEPNKSQMLFVCQRPCMPLIEIIEE